MDSKSTPANFVVYGASGAAIKAVEQPMEDLIKEVNAIELKMKELQRKLYGDSNKRRLDIDQPPTPAGRIGWIGYEQKYSTSAPTKTHQESYAIAKEEFQPILEELRTLATVDLDRLEQKLEDADSPYTPGRAIKMINRE